MGFRFLLSNMAAFTLWSCHERTLFALFFALEMEIKGART